jgi:hypothetical protein
MSGSLSAIYYKAEQTTVHGLEASLENFKSGLWCDRHTVIYLDVIVPTK